ncbi:hypothetical protein HN51_006056 [Arachis hypogaea]|uniref:uncharacterized protein n=1 Tax=Arachis hypogaea TaxID=3818 RepID=UPI000DECBFCC|nr:uncharacterized protein LOC112797653 [Arachis hypogaea]XP_025696488.1 uncharacterized protein LOC112797653 [Arachis hypogaea]XP_025696489.1 uncharacterized protein LOC112797653 [Arachis hypogaea]QHO39925.1 uncharacterized protein DS421_4g133310 [Arachis hypogaea]QHO39926.1 uncharacterized protein DS421_4g133310 [Arachis hypogaea]QHO39927.1 uncharacterized protein DS421_4g133310 [Arachis hypogaea]QHO39928.1 uncharacterized protein DS421_4g133310 [Arachis hypogaea]
MNVLARTSLNKMSRARGQSSGWTAFDLKQKKKNGLTSEIDKDPFPPVGASNLIRNDDKLVKKNHVRAKSFSSVLLPTQNFPTLKEGGKSQTPMTDSDSGGKYCATTAQDDADLAIKKLKEKHHWADDSLIEDILAAVSNDVDKAATLLETMASAVNIEECKISSDLGAANSYYGPCKEKIDESLMLGKGTDDITINSSVGHLKDNGKDFVDRNASPDEKFYDDNVRCQLGPLNSVPVEPEWEEDDVYLSHRKDALKTMRLASRHSRAAANAFLRGDHFSAQQHSMKAREEWHTAEELNSTAATKILNIRNSENDISRLDLHGLHAAEAIRALQEHLLKIESQGFSKTSATSNGVKVNNGLTHSTLGSLNSVDSENSDKQAPIRLKSVALHVITGVGNHSRGQAALPTAVRSFLSENRYRFEEMRPGVITVWPKFRQSLMLNPI